MLREGIRVLSQALIESEVAGLIGAERHVRSITAHQRSEFNEFVTVSSNQITETFQNKSPDLIEASGHEHVPTGAGVCLVKN